MKNLFIRYLAILFFVLFQLIQQAWAQTAYFNVSTEKSGKEFSFPVLAGAGNQAIAMNRINQFLQLSELGLLKGAETASIFERINSEGGTPDGKRVELNYKVYTNSPKVLSMQFKDNTCGTSDCMMSVRYLNFNSGNGDLIHLKDLFTSDGYATFFKYLTQKRIKAFNADFAKLDADAQLVMESVKSCYEESTLNDFYIKDNSLYIDGENCFYNTQKFEAVKRLDNFALIEFKNYLNDYGKSVFSLSNAAVSGYRSHVLPQLFEGKAYEDSSMIFILNTYYQEDVRAIYAYTKTGIGVHLEGTLKLKELKLMETPKQISETPFIEAIYDGLKIEGTFVNRDKRMPLSIPFSVKQP